MFDGKSILITGGAGSFGQAFIKRPLSHHKSRRISGARDELTQYDMQQEFNGPEMRYSTSDASVGQEPLWGTMPLCCRTEKKRGLVDYIGGYTHQSDSTSTINLKHKAKVTKRMQTQLITDARGRKTGVTIPLQEGERTQQAKDILEHVYLAGIIEKRKMI